MIIDHVTLSREAAKRLFRKVEILRYLNKKQGSRPPIFAANYANWHEFLNQFA